MWFIHFYLAIPEWEAQRRQLSKEKEKQVFQYFEVNMVLLISTKPAPFGCFKELA